MRVECDFYKIASSSIALARAVGFSTSRKAYACLATKICIRKKLNAQKMAEPISIY